MESLLTLSRRVDAVRPSGTKAMTARAAQLKAEGRPVIALSQGELDFDTPEHIRAAAVEAIACGKTRYTAVAGIRELRRAIAGKLSRDNGLSYGEEEITVGCGAKQVLFNALFATLNPGDEVLIPTPCWVSYPDMVTMASGRPVLIECGPANGFKLTAEALAAAITPRTRWLMLNSPANPTGAVYSRTELAALTTVLLRHPQIMILSDEIYEKLVYGSSKATSIANISEVLRRRTLIVNGFSKADAMTGWRIGYGAGDPKLIAAMNKIQGQTTSHTSSISQYAALAALCAPQPHIASFVSELERRRDILVERLNAVDGLSCGSPDGAFYVFACCAGLIGRRTAAGLVVESDRALADYLLEEANVAVVAGSEFLLSPYIRISYAASRRDIEEACARIHAACEGLQ